ncbi:MAG: hypothetical protein ACI8QD_002040 [Cyclobacteriaceae bacterium]|jgi:hypothetical protein
MKIFLLLSFASTLFNTGLIWVIQLVHYPGFARIGVQEHQAYHSFHMRSITYIVGPSMAIELASSLGLLLFLDKLPSPTAFWIASGLLAIIWAHTAFIAVPLHGKLASSYSLEIVDRLVSANWWRTIAWSIRSFVLAYLVYQAIK